MGCHALFQGLNPGLQHWQVGSLPEKLICPQRLGIKETKPLWTNRREHFLTKNTHTTTKSLQSCPTLCDPTDCSLSGFSVHGIFRATVLEWGAIAFSKAVLINKLEINFTHSQKCCSTAPRHVSRLRKTSCVCPEARPSALKDRAPRQFSLVYLV